MADLYKREKYLEKIRPYYDDMNIVKIFTGVRGCGKSTLLELIMDELKERSIKDEKIIKINLEKRPYKGVRSAKKLIETVTEKSEGVIGVKYLFIDEIHNVEDYENALNHICEMSDFSIFVTSSNGYILKQKHLGKLTMFYINYEIFTLTFEEYLDMREYYGYAVSPNTEEEFTKYMIEGGFPYTVSNDIHDAKQQYAKDILSEIIENDIRHHKRIKNPAMFDCIKSYIINNFGKKIVAKDLIEYISETLNTNVRKETLYNYLGILEDSRIVYKCARFDMDSKQVLHGKEKYYLPDLSFYYAEDLYNTLNYEPSLENVIHNYARSLDYATALCRSGHQNIDFVLEDEDMDYIYVQVTDYIDNGEFDENGRTKEEEREYIPLEKIRDFYPRYVMTLDKILRKRNGIKQRNIIDFIKKGRKF